MKSFEYADVRQKTHVAIEEEEDEVCHLSSDQKQEMGEESFDEVQIEQQTHLMQSQQIALFKHNLTQQRMLRKIKALDDSSSSSDGLEYDQEDDGNPSMMMEDLRNFQPPELLDFPQDEEKKTQEASSSMQTKQAHP